MFTGIIKNIGKIAAIRKVRTQWGDGMSVMVESDFKSVYLGESISVEGVCLTVVQKKRGKKGTDFLFEIGEETLRKTILGKLKTGNRVNLEKAMKGMERFDGHFVQGHVDATGKILKIAPEGNSKMFTFSLPKTIVPYVVEKGSVAVDGISLTALKVKKDSFSVSILNYTEENTTLKYKKVGADVNLEADMMAKIIAKQVQLFLKETKFNAQSI